MTSSKVQQAYEEGARLEKAFSLSARKTVTKKMQQATVPILELLGAKKDEPIFFLSSYEEVLLRVLYEVILPKAQRTGKNEILLPKGEHNRLKTIIHTAGRLGLSFKEVDIDDSGKVTKENLEKAKTKRTVAFFLSWTEQFTGVIHPIFEIASFCNAEEVFLYVDATESVGKVFFRFQDIGVDILSFTFNKLTAVVAKKPDLMKSTRWGENFCIKEFFAMSAYSQHALSVMDIDPMEYSQIKTEVIDRVEQSPIECTFFNKGGGYLYDRWCFAFKGVNAENLAYFLREKKIFVEYRDVNKVLRDRNLLEKNINGAVSLKFSTEISKVNLFQMWEKIINTAKEIKEYSYD